LSGFRIKKLGVKIEFAGLLFFGTSVMIDGKEDAVVFLASRSKIKGRFATIASDLKARTEPTGFKSDVIKTLAFLRIQEALNVI
jgi:hypothetical protein